MKLACYKIFKIAIFACFVFSWAGISVAQADKEQEIKRIYKQLIDAENKHDLPAVRALVWNSPSTLFVAKAPVGWHGYWGIDDVMQHLHDIYQQSFRHTLRPRRDRAPPSVLEYRDRAPAAPVAGRSWPLARQA
jgi:hypothetical protein